MSVCLSPNGLNEYHADEPPTRLLVGTRDGVAILVRDEPSSAWRLSERVLEGQHISALLIEPGTGAVFAGVHWGGVFVSQDDGRSWEQRNAGIAQNHVFTLRCQVRPGQPTRVFAGTEPVSLYWTDDLGLSWHDLASLREVPGQEHWTFPPPPHIAHVKTAAFDPREPRRFFVGIEQGALFRTDDDGQTWTELKGFSHLGDPIYSDVHQIKLRPTQPDEIFMPTGAGLYHSQDQGASWHELTGGDFRIGYPDQLLFSPEDDRLLFLAGSRETPADWRHTHHADGTIMRSRDGGQTWEPCRAGIPDDLHANIEAMALASYPGGYDLFAGTTDGDVFTSRDRGETWALAAGGLEAVSKVGHYRNLMTARA
jgi:photosystem II stability/assembly factor-like uncharacterized protein